MLNKEIILRDAGGNQVTFKYRHMQIIPDSSMENLKGRRGCTDVLQSLRNHRCQSKLLDLGNLLVTIKKTRYSLLEFNSNFIYVKFPSYR